MCRDESWVISHEQRMGVVSHAQTKMQSFVDKRVMSDKEQLIKIYLEVVHRYRCR